VHAHMHAHTKASGIQNLRNLAAASRHAAQENSLRRYNLKPLSLSTKLHTRHPTFVLICPWIEKSLQSLHR
jgi:hypothetical protein